MNDSASRRPICEDDLHAWADGRLDAARRAEVEAWLAEDAARATRVAGWRQDTGLLHRTFDGLVDEPVPSRLAATVAAGSRRRPLAAAAAAGWLVLGALLGAAGGYGYGHDTAPAPSPLASLPRRAAIAHAVYTPEVRHPVEVGADEERHLVAWLSKRLGAPLRVPYLGDRGFDLLGGRLLPAGGGPGAQFMYQDAAGRRLTLFVSVGAEASTPAAFRYAQENGVGVFYWVDEGFAYALSGTLPKAELLPLADDVYRQLAP